MPFVNEVVSDDDIDRYGLPFAKGGGRYWTRDRERDAYLWGGQSGNPARDEDLVGEFHFFISGIKLWITLGFGSWSKDWTAKPYFIEWKELIALYPPECGGLEKGEVISLLKEALVAYGRDGRINQNTPDRVVEFGF